MADRVDEATASSLHLELFGNQISQTIGNRLREERRQQGLTLRDVARRSGLSLGMISKIENAQTSPSLSTLARLSHALELPLTAFFRGFEEERDASYVRPGEGIEFARHGTRHGHRYQLLGATKGRTVVQPFLVTLTERSEAFPLFQHRGIEFIYCLDGTFTYRYGRTAYDVYPGVSLMYDGQVPHGPERLAQLPIKFLSVMVEQPQGGDEAPARHRSRRTRIREVGEAS